MESVQVSTRVSKDIKEAAQKIFERQGLDISVVIKMLLTKTANEGRIPLDIYDTGEKGDDLTELAFSKSPVKEVDWNNKEEVEGILDEW